MVDPIQELKIRAEILQRCIASGDEQARARLRQLNELRRADDAALKTAATQIKRKHCLTVLAREHGFASWEHALRVLEGTDGNPDQGTLLYSGQGALNVWFARHEEARAHLKALRDKGITHYLLPYRRQFFVADRDFVAALGIDPDDAAWHMLDHDWMTPQQADAKRRLFGQRMSTLRRAS